MNKVRTVSRYYVEIYNKETNEEVFTLEVVDGKFDAAQKQKHDEILLADTERKYGRRILEAFEGNRMRSEEAILLLRTKLIDKLDEVD